MKIVAFRWEHHKSFGVASLQIEFQLLTSPRFGCRVAQSAGIGELDSSIAKDLIDSEDPKHTQFCREITFVAIYALFRDDISIL